MVLGISIIVTFFLYCFIYWFLYINDFMTWLLTISIVSAVISALLLVVFASKSEFYDIFGSPGNNYPFY